MDDEFFDEEHFEDDGNEFGHLDEIVADELGATGEWSDTLVLDIKEQPTGELSLDPDIVRRMLERHGMPSDSVLIDALITIAQLKNAYGSKDAALHSHLCDLESFIYAMTTEIAQHPVHYVTSLVTSVKDPIKRAEIMTGIQSELDKLQSE